MVADWPKPHAICQPVPLTEVDAGGYVGKRIDRNRESILLALESPIPKDFEAAVAGTAHPKYRLAADSDLYKWLEGACYEYAYTKDPVIKKEIDRIVGLIIEVQDEDGYINAQPGKKRWDPKVMHDMYIAGHFFEAAVAHHRATGEQQLLNAACRWADFLIDAYHEGHEYFKTTMYSEHPEYELGLLRLYRETEDRRYLDFSIALTKYSRVGATVAEIKAPRSLHAVRVGYLLAGMADIYMETGSEEMLQYLPGLWDELVNTRMYVTGAIGSHGEGISSVPYELPQEGGGDGVHRHMGETCSSVAMIMFSWRMHGITGESKYFDVIEKVLYNHYLGAIALNGLGSFYYNPMRMVGDLSGKTDHGHRPMSARCMLPNINRTACCPSNMWRFFGALPEYLFSYDEDGLFINLYTNSTVNHTLADGRQIALSVETEYPHQGDVKVRFDGETPTPFALRLRIPGWCEAATAQWPGQEEKPVESGEYLVIDREWKKGDTVQLHFEMPVRMVLPHPKVRANAGQVVFGRGPVLFCLEKEDVDFPVEEATVAIQSEEEARETVEVTWHPDLLDGIHMLHVPGLVDGKNVDLKLVPWSVRANRSENSRWLIFLPLAGATRGRDAVKASHTYERDTVDALWLHNLPKSSRDRTIPRWTSWPQKGKSQWVELDLGEEKQVASFGVYWYDDGNGVWVPESWYLEARNGSEEPWQRVQAAETSGYGTSQNQFNVMTPAEDLSARYLRIV